MSSSSIFRNLAQVDPLTISFQLTPTQVAYANTLRRMVLTGVEGVAFRSDMNDKGATTDVIVKSNTTPMTNEMLADRIGLIPIHVETPGSWNPDEYIFELNVVNDSTDVRDVTTADFSVKKKALSPGEEDSLVGNKEFFHANPITNDNVLIAVLKGKQVNQNPQKIEVLAKATVGTGRDHIRFSPVSQCSYSYTIDTDESRQKMFYERWLMNNKKIDPKSLESDSDRASKLQREFQTMEVQRCFLVNEKNEPYSFDFVVETLGVQKPERIIERALMNIESKCSLYSNMASGTLPPNVRVQPADARMKGFDFIIGKEDHTLGNLIQTWMEDNLMDSGEITYVGYKVPHPLRDEMLLRVGVDDGQELTARAMVGKATAACANMFRLWREDWIRVSSAGAGTRTRATLKPTLANAKAMVEAKSQAQTQAQTQKKTPAAKKTAAKV